MQYRSVRYGTFLIDSALWCFNNETFNKFTLKRAHQRQCFNLHHVTASHLQERRKDKRFVVVITVVLRQIHFLPQQIDNC